MRRIELEIQVAGGLFRQGFAPAPNRRTTFTWDGRNAYGQIVQGMQPITVRIGYTYRAVYGTTSRFGYSGGMITGSQARQELTLWRTWQDQIGTWDARAAALGGWTLSAHHAYDPGEQVLYRGDGARQSAKALGPTLRRLELVHAGVRPGDLLIATEGGAITFAMRCRQRCTVRRIGRGPTATHGEGHLTVVPAARPARSTP